MKIENQVCSLLQAKKLKELGIEQKSVFYNHTDWNNPKTDSELYDRYGIVFKESSVSLFTTSELGAMLQIWTPDFINIWSEWGYKEIDGTPRGYQYQAEASAARLIHLIENNKITIEDCNTRLNS